MDIHGRAGCATDTGVSARLLLPFTRTGIFYPGITGRRGRRLRHLLCRWMHPPGFTGNRQPVWKQVYVGDLKTVQVYTASPQTVQKLLEKYEIPEEPGCLKLWDILSDENPCELIHVEVEEENIFDLPELLSEAGIYFSGRRED